ncbi:MAG: beta family protein [Bacillota bacterium]
MPKKETVDWTAMKKAVVSNARYIPVLRFRQEERMALTQISLTSKSLPMIEVLKEKPHASMNGTFSELAERLFGSLKFPVILDFPMAYRVRSSTPAEIGNFLRPIQTNQQQRLNRYSQLKNIKNIIPVVSYNPSIKKLNPKEISSTASSLRKHFDTLAFRFYFDHFTDALSGASSVVSPGDILILDLDQAAHTSPVFGPLYQSISELKKVKQFRSVVIRSAINADIFNNQLIDDMPIASADNSLRDAFSAYGFDAFGDYAGIKRDEIRKGGTISPGVIFYSWHDNVYVGYRGIQHDLDSFANVIVPNLLKSRYWRLYSKAHRNSCPGCKVILNIAAGNDTGANQAKWKRIAIMHYIYTMEEFL